MAYNEIVGSYAGITFGISNSIAQLTGVIVPYTVAAITKNVNIIFLINQIGIRYLLYLSKLTPNGKLFL